MKFGSVGLLDLCSAIKLSTRSRAPLTGKGSLLNLRRSSRSEPEDMLVSEFAWEASIPWRTRSTLR